MLWEFIGNSERTKYLEGAPLFKYLDSEVGLKVLLIPAKISPVDYFVKQKQLSLYLDFPRRFRILIPLAIYNS